MLGTNMAMLTRANNNTFYYKYNKLARIIVK